MVKNEELDFNQTRISLAMFLESYNENIPAGFPVASVAILKKFRGIYPALFKHGNMWSVDLHRKKVIDWLSSYRDAS